MNLLCGYFGGVDLLVIFDLLYNNIEEINGMFVIF